MPDQEVEIPGGLKPLRLAFGTFSLLLGVLLICFFHLLFSLFLLSVASSVEAIQLVGIRIRPWTQVLGASYALGGMPLVIVAGVSALYRIKKPLMVYLYYLGGTFVLNISWLASLLYEADLCSSVVPESFINMGPSFVCGISDSLVFTCFLATALFALYFMWIVWSAAQEIGGFEVMLLQQPGQMKQKKSAEAEPDDEPKAPRPYGTQNMMQGYAGGGMQYGQMQGYGGGMQHGQMPPQGFGHGQMPQGYGGGMQYGSFANAPRPSMPVQQY